MAHYFTATYVGMVACVKRIATRGSCLCTLSASNTFIPCMQTLLASSFIPRPYIFLISTRNLLINFYMYNQLRLAPSIP